MSINTQVFIAMDRAVESIDGAIDTLDVILTAGTAKDRPRIQECLDRLQWLRVELLTIGLDATADPQPDAHLEAAYEDRTCLE